jgi:SAM-dependent methyltransferase
MSEAREIARTEGRRLFGDDPAAYERGRPDYPAALYDALRRRCGLGPGSRVFEVGPGTGIATRRLLELQPAMVWAVEPDPRLARYLREALDDPRLRIVESAFEDAPLAPAGFDVGVAAMSFHWLKPHEALTKVAEALAPGGWWAMWWTVYGRDASDDAFAQASRPLFASLPSGPSGSGRDRPPFALDESARLREFAEAGLEDARVERWSWDEPFSTSRIVDLYSTFSAVNALPAPQREDFLRRLARIADEQFGGRLSRPLQAILYTARRSQ